MVSSLRLISTSYDALNACGSQRKGVVPATAADATGDVSVTWGLRLTTCFVADQVRPLSSESMAWTRHSSVPSG